jgi:hypothetical protein
VERVDYENIQGVRYVTFFTQNNTPVLDTELLYVFQGITTDGAYYIAALFPVVSGLFPEDSDMLFGNEEIYADAEEALNALDAGDFLPPLDSLDALVETITIDE